MRVGVIPIRPIGALAKSRAAYVGFPQALKPPFVRKGDGLDAATFWHGALLNRWANEWVAYWTHGSGNFVTSAMEDTGVLTSLTETDGLIELPEDVTTVEPGSTVGFLSYAALTG